MRGGCIGATQSDRRHACGFGLKPSPAQSRPGVGAGCGALPARRCVWVQAYGGATTDHVEIQPRPVMSARVVEHATSPHAPYRASTIPPPKSTPACRRRCRVPTRWPDRPPRTSEAIDELEVLEGASSAGVGHRDRRPLAQHLHEVLLDARLLALDIHSVNEELDAVLRKVLEGLGAEGVGSELLPPIGDDEEGPAGSRRRQLRSSTSRSLPTVWTISASRSESSCPRGRRTR